MKTESFFEPSRWTPIVFALLSVFLVLVSIDRVLQIRGNYREVSPQTLTVTGEGRVAAEMESVDISFTIFSQESTVKAMQKVIAKSYTDIMAELKTMGIEEKDIRRQNYTVYPQYNYGTSPLTVNIFEGRQMMALTLRDISKMDQVMLSLAAHNATDINPMQYTPKNKEAVYAEAAKKAIDMAYEEAKQTAEKTGRSLGKVTFMSVTNNAYSSPYGYMTPYEIYAQVSVGYELK